MLDDDARRKLAAIKKRSLVDAYRRIEERGMERFDPGVFKRLYKAAFDRDLDEEDLDEQMVFYSMYENCGLADGLSMPGYVSYREWMEVNWGG